MKPNIFDIATKELSQDAFLTWLLLWADDSNKSEDANLNLCAKNFVQQLLLKQQTEIIDIRKVTAGRQWENIDIWAEVNDKYLIIIEDKTYTNAHSNQLIRYKETASNECASRGMELICIYLKTGNESLGSLNQVENQGFAVFDRKNLIDIFAEYSKVHNNIFRDFYDRLTRLEEVNLRYKNTEIGKWNGSDWVGFYQYLEKETDLIAGWGYVNNQSGGFWNASLPWIYGEYFAIYLQIEQGLLCFKICTDPDEVDFDTTKYNRSNVRNEFCHLIISKADQSGVLGVKRPNRFGTGKFMTVAVIDKELWFGRDTDLPNLRQIAERLVKYNDFLKEVINLLPNE